MYSPEEHVAARQVRPPVADSRTASQLIHLGVNFSSDALGGNDAVLSNIVEDLGEVRSRFHR
ncbi:MAG: hypothetical protein JO307_05000 [Bryobacterales bacterium]|nr:hypothetical protein [Bryobacterales bacterium]MBV9401231.1 hypothetical protein [Bryobacterales bacterium]